MVKYDWSKLRTAAQMAGQEPDEAVYLFLLEVLDDAKEYFAALFDEERVTEGQETP